MSDEKSSGASSKEELELEKLRHDVQVLRKPLWQDPKLVGTVVAFLISLGFNIAQVLNGNAEAKRKDVELALRTQEFNSQRQKVEAEVERLRQQIAAAAKSVASCTNADVELAQIVKDIQYSTEALARERAELASSKDRLREADSKGFSQSADAWRLEISTFERWVLQLTESRDTAVKRRSELESRCK